MGPDIEEGAVAHPPQLPGKAVDIAGMPVRGLRYLRIGAPAVVVDPGDDAMVAVFKADIGRIDLPRRGQRLIEQFPALLLLERLGVFGSDRSQQLERGRYRVDEILCLFETGTLGLRDIVLQGVIAAEF
jgi:hypothetical protein